MVLKYLGAPGLEVPSANSGVAGWRGPSHLQGESTVTGGFQRTAPERDWCGHLQLSSSIYPGNSPGGNDSLDLGRRLWKFLISKMSITFLLQQKGHLLTLVPASKERAEGLGLQ